MNKIKVLFIDDEQENLNVFKANFRRDFSIFLCNNTEKAVDIIDRNDIQVVISDYKMPGENGLKFFERIAKSHPKVIRILITAFGDYDLIKKSINKANIFRFISKPWDNVFFKEAIRNAGEVFLLNQRNEQLKHSYLQLFNDSPSLLILEKDNKVVNINNAAKSLFKIDQDAIKKGFSMRDLLGCEVSSEKESIVIYKIQDQKIELQIIPKVITLENEENILFNLVDVSDILIKERLLKEQIAKVERVEREKLAMEIHDGLGQELVLLKLMVERIMLKNEVEKDELNSLFLAIQDTIAKTRNLSYNLDPPGLNDGFLPLLQSLMSKMNTVSKTNYICNISSEASEEWVKLNLSEEIIYQLYRVTQEFFNNSEKHAGATECTLTLILDNDLIKLILSDNGIGFNINSTFKGKGLSNMKNRLSSNRLNYEMDSLEDKGSRLTVYWQRSTKQKV
jgi:signal transduction histidine kinase